MKTLRLALDIDRPPSEVFALLHDHERRLQWDSYLVESRLLDEGCGVGKRALSKNRHGSTMITVYTSWQPPHLAAIRMTQGPWWMRRFSGAWQVREKTAESSVLEFHYRFELDQRLRWLHPLAQWLFRRDMAKRLAGFKAYIAGPPKNGIDNPLNKALYSKD